MSSSFDLENQTGSDHSTVKTTIHADPDWIGMMRLYLCVNARDAIPEGGTLIIETSRGSRVILEVQIVQTLLVF